MKHINILSLIQAFDNLETEEYENFLVYHDIKIKDEEVNDLESLILVLNDREGIKSIFSQFYVGFNIPQIAKEFDLLRFGEKSIINIELKSSSTEDKILKQLKQNRYYLKFINKKVYNFTFVSDKNKLYHLNDDATLDEMYFKDLVELLYNQEVKSIENIDKLFNPSDYLVSPFNSTKKFIKNKYFLTQQQESIKSKIIYALKYNSKANFFAVTGSAGTGKTLLTYDTAKEIINDKKRVLIIHCGYLNAGQRILNTTYNWKIIEIKNYNSYEISDYDLIVVDEAQRIYTKQLDDIVEKIQNSNGNCIFSYDKVQTLSSWEERCDIDDKINKITSIIAYKLSEKIRTNKEIASFIKMLFNKKRNIQLLNKNNIEVSYFDNDDDAKEFLDTLGEQNWEVIRFTPSQYHNEQHEKCSILTTETSHKVIGQEFDNVAVVLDKYFSYNDESGKLMYGSRSYYHPVKMLFQNVTRTRKKLHMVIVNNSEMLNRCLSILS